MVASNTSAAALLHSRGSLNCHQPYPNSLTVQAAGPAGKISSLLKQVGNQVHILRYFFFPSSILDEVAL